MHRPGAAGGWRLEITGGGNAQGTQTAVINVIVVAGRGT